MDIMKLNIQLFAEEGATNVESGDNATPVAGDNATTPIKPTFTELLKDPAYQSEFDKLVGKSLDTAKSKWETDFKAKIEAERSEAEKLAQMDATQKSEYESQKMKDRIAELESQINASNLYKTASGIATEKGLPQGYLDLIDFTKETAETIGNKIDTLVELRQSDIQSYLNNKLKQPTPVEKKAEQTIDPYIEGFKSEF